MSSTTPAKRAQAPRTGRKTVPSPPLVVTHQAKPLLNPPRRRVRAMEPTPAARQLTPALRLLARGTLVNQSRALLKGSSIANASNPPGTRKLGVLWAYTSLPTRETCLCPHRPGTWWVFHHPSPIASGTQSMGRPRRRPTRLWPAGPRIWHGPRRQTFTPAPCPSALVVLPGGRQASQLRHPLHGLQLPVVRLPRRARLPNRTRSQPPVRQRERAMLAARNRSHRAQPRLRNAQRRPASPRYHRRSLPRRRLP